MAALPGCWPPVACGGRTARQTNQVGAPRLIAAATATAIGPPYLLSCAQSHKAPRLRVAIPRQESCGRVRRGPQAVHSAQQQHNARAVCSCVLAVETEVRARELRHGEEFLSNSDCSLAADKLAISKKRPQSSLPSGGNQLAQLVCARGTNICQLGELCDNSLQLIDADRELLEFGSR